MVVFALSCFGLLLFLWLSFGGPIPLKPKGYRVQVALPRGDAARPRGRRARGRRVGRQAAQEDARPERQPHARDARDRPQVRAAARRHEGDPAPEDAARRDLRGADAGLVGADDPRGRAAAQRAGQEDRRARRDLPTRSTRRRARRSAAGSRSSRRASTAAGRTSTTRSARCPASPTTAPTSSRCSTRSRARCTRLVKNTGVTFGALTENEQQLQNLITSSRARSSRPPPRSSDNLAETIRIFPTFLDESKATVARLQTFSTNTRAAGPRPDPGRAGPQADAARRARAVTRPAQLLPQPRPADQGQPHRPAGRARDRSAGSSRRSPS